MRKFVYKLIIYISILVMICFACIVFHFYVVGNQYEEGYNASIQDKISLLKNTSGPKIILIGNSNLSFGIDSELLKKELNMPVVNLGLHGGLGNIFHENMAMYNIQKGDILIICHSDFSDKGTISDYALAWITLEWHRDLWGIVPQSEYINMVKAYPRYFISALRLWVLSKGNKSTDNCYSRKAFNFYGDVIYKPDKDQIDTSTFFMKKENNDTVPNINDICVERINRLHLLVASKGAYLLVAGYPITNGNYSHYSVTDFDNFESKLRSRLSCKVISHYRDYMMPYSMFYNGRLHLTEVGRHLRTSILVKDIKRWKENTIY